eukprot:Rhum_TRINITY_DN14570_c5_g1::Rhum_TRINITY_DN14570_c5_g1_i1::g.100178::m.100178
MGLEESTRELQQANKWKALLVLRDSAVVLEEPSGAAGSGVALLSGLAEKSKEEAVGVRVCIGGADYEVHSHYAHDGANVTSGRQSVDPKATDVPKPDGWTMVSKGGVSVVATYPIDVTAARVVRQLLPLL